ncbi:hypothetical protein QN362_04355 [Actimicrobium sp. CCC2.4]|nr:hypothetical protein [Actimicrobium sp. CCC2.4]
MGKLELRLGKLKAAGLEARVKILAAKNLNNERAVLDKNSKNSIIVLTGAAPQVSTSCDQKMLSKPQE